MQDLADIAKAGLFQRRSQATIPTIPATGQNTNLTKESLSHRDHGIECQTQASVPNLGNLNVEQIIAHGVEQKICPQSLPSFWKENVQMVQNHDISSFSNGFNDEVYTFDSFVPEHCDQSGQLGYYGWFLTMLLFRFFALILILLSSSDNDYAQSESSGSNSFI